MTFDWSSYAYIEYEGKIICVRKQRKNAENPWHLPEGKRNPLELTWQDTLIRELYEETGIHVYPYQLKRIDRRQRYTFKKERGRWKKHFYDCILYKVDITPKQFLNRDQITIKEEEMSLFTRREIEEMDKFLPKHRRVLREAIPIRHDGEELESV